MNENYYSTIMYFQIGRKVRRRFRLIDRRLFYTQSAVEMFRCRGRIIKTLILSVSIYFICYSPIQIALFLVISGERLVGWLMIGLNALVLLNAAANPILYSIFLPRFREKIRQLLCCKWREPRTSSSSLIQADFQPLRKPSSNMAETLETML